MEKNKIFDWKFLSVLGISLIAVGLSVAGFIKGSVPGPQGEQGLVGPKGDPGDKGGDGLTPTISINQDGYWVINGTTTEVLAQGKNGTNGTTPTISINQDGYWVINGTTTEVLANGQDGDDGDNGKSAYEIAVENGYKGTELEFANDLLTNNMSYGTMRNIALNAMFSYGINFLSGDFADSSDAQKVIDNFEPFTLEITSSATNDLLDDNGPVTCSYNTASISYDFNADNDIIGHMIFLNIFEEGNQHKDEVYLAVIKDDSMNKHYYVTFECTMSDEPDVWSTEFQYYQEMSKDYYDFFTATMIAQSRYMSELYTVGNIFMPTDMLAFLLAFDTDGTKLNSLLTYAALSDCTLENDTYKVVTELPGSESLESYELTFGLLDNGRIQSADSIQNIDNFTNVETYSVAFSVSDVVVFDELTAIPSEFTSYYDSGNPDYEPIILDSDTDPSLDDIYTIIDCIKQNFTDALTPIIF